MVSAYQWQNITDLRQTIKANLAKLLRNVEGLLWGGAGEQNCCSSLVFWLLMFVSKFYVIPNYNFLKQFIMQRYGAPLKNFFDQFNFQSKTSEQGMWLVVLAFLRPYVWSRALQKENLRTEDKGPSLRLLLCILHAMLLWSPASSRVTPESRVRSSPNDLPATEKPKVRNF